MIVVIGGGIAGLAAAFELAARRIPFVLLEASSRLGGLIRTEHVEGFTLEAGADSVLVQKRAALELFEELKLTPHVQTMRRPRTAFVLKHGRLHPLPAPSILGIPTTLGAIASYDLLPPAARVRLALEPFVPARAASDESVASFFRRRFGAATVASIAEPLLGGIHAGDIEQLSVRSLFPRLADVEHAGRSVIREFRPRPRSGDDEGPFRSLRGGMSTLVAAIEARLPAGSVRLSTAAEYIERHGTGWRVSTSSGAIDTRGVLVAAPAHAAARLFARVNRDVAELCAQVRYVSTVSIALVFPRHAIGHRLDGSGFVVARRYNALRTTACTWVSSKWDARAPDGFALLRVYGGGSHDPDAVDLDDDALVEMGTRDLAPVIDVRGAPLMSRVYRWRNAGAQHNVGQLDRVARIEQRLAGAPGLFVAGSGFRSTGIPDCIADGRAAARAAAAWLQG